MKANKNTIMKRLVRLMPDCKEITLLIVKEQEVTLSLKEKFDMHFHLMICKFCKAFRIQSGVLHQHIRRVAHNESEYVVKNTLDPQKKAAIQDAVERYLSK